MTHEKLHVIEHWNCIRMPKAISNGNPNGSKHKYQPAGEKIGNLQKKTFFHFDLKAKLIIILYIYIYTMR